MNNRNKSLVIAFLLSTFLLFSLFSPSVDGAFESENTSDLEIKSSSLFCHSHDTTINIDSLDSLEVEETMIIENLDFDAVTELQFNFQHQFEDLIIFDKEFGILDSTNTSDTLTVNLGSELRHNDTIILKLNYDLDSEHYISIVENRPNYYNFAFNFNMSFFTSIYSMNLRLPVNCFTHDVSDSYSPNAAIILSDNRLHFSWVYRNLDAQTQKQVYVKFDAPLTDSTPAWVFIISSLSGVLAGLGIAYLLILRKQRKTLQKIGDIFLTEAQKTLLIIISEKGGKISQGDLVRLTGFSKSKVSRNLSPLEENKFILREKWGNKYKISLTVQGKKVIE